jgi:hypothetical protein
MSFGYDAALTAYLGEAFSQDGMSVGFVVISRSNSQIAASASLPPHDDTSAEIS